MGFIQVVLSCEADDVDFDNAAACVRNFHIINQMDFLRRLLPQLLIIDIYKKRGRCAVELRKLKPHLHTVQMQRLRHMLRLGANVNVGGTKNM